MKKKLIALVLSGVMAASFVACGSDTATSEAPVTSGEVTEQAAATEATEAPAAQEVVEGAAEEVAAGDAGFVENEIFSDEQLAFINLSAVWFQAVPMENETMSYSAEDADIHIEADISALENNLGYGVGDWIPYLTVDYDIQDTDGNSVVSGTFMEMAASDGPHYGNNIKLDPGTYNLKITIHSPGENGYLIHSDSETGPGGLLSDYFADGPLTYTFEGWDFAGLE
ncbi:MAG: iron transporter [Lachnospiraceae bacterium]|nr:iron transporter [Lachnospiraceae bacterium]